MRPLPKTFSLRRLYLALACAACLPLGIAFAAKVKDVVVRFDDGSEEVIPAAATIPMPQPKTQPAPPASQPAPADGEKGAPSISIVTPAAQVKIAAPGFLVIRAEASDADGAVSKVEFWIGDTLIDTATAPPYMTAWNDIRPGKYEVIAKAFDDQNNATRSAPSKVTVVEVERGQTIVVKPGESISAASVRAGPGDTVLVKAGTYRESVLVSNGGTPDRPVNYVFDPNAVIDATNKEFAFIPAAIAKNVIVSGLHVVGCTNGMQGQNAAVRTTDGWRLTDVTVEKVKGTGIGVLGTGVTLLRCIAKDNGQNGNQLGEGESGAGQRLHHQQ